MRSYNSKINKKYRDKVKDRIFHALGGYKCSCNNNKCWHEGSCNITDKRCLQIDHIHGDGSLIKKYFSEEHKTGSITARYLHYLREPRVLATLQVLCANCNWVKRENLKEIKHIL